MTGGTAETEHVPSCSIHIYIYSMVNDQSVVYSRGDTCVPGGVSDRGSSLSACKGGVSSTALSGILNGVGMAPIFASRLGGSSLVMPQIEVSEYVKSLIGHCIKYDIQANQSTDIPLHIKIQD